MPRNIIKNKVVREAIMLYACADRFFFRFQEAAQNAIGGFFDGALTDEEKTELGIVLSDYSLRRSSPSRGLWKWEEEWFNKWLPKPPKRLLIGAAGTGREAVALARSGYRIDAFEPATFAARKCAEALGDKGRVFIGRYEDLNRAVIDSKGSPLAEIALESYDAIILGWGSLTHVIDERERERLLQSCWRLGKNAPILASFWLRSSEISMNKSSRVKKYAARLGSIVAAFRGNRSQLCREPFACSFGFVHSFTRGEIEQLAIATHSRVIWGSNNEYPHATFVPESPK